MNTGKLKQAPLLLLNQHSQSKFVALKEDPSSRFFLKKQVTWIWIRFILCERVS